MYAQPSVVKSGKKLFIIFYLYVIISYQKYIEKTKVKRVKKKKKIFFNVMLPDVLWGIQKQFLKNDYSLLGCEVLKKFIL